MAGRSRRVLVATGMAIALVAPLASAVEGSQAAGASGSPPVTPATIYDSTSTPLVASPSQSFEAGSIAEFGNKVQFTAGSPRLLDNVVVTMDSWACQTGSWDYSAGDGLCTTTPGSSFTEPITLNLYDVGANNAVGSQIASVTQTFAIPYRPSSDPTDCPDMQTFLYDGSCVHGLPVNITFDLGDTVVPDNVIWSLAYNTSDYGYAPYGEGTACHSTPIVPTPASPPYTYDDCGYDSLNMLLTEANGPSVGSDPVPGTAYMNAAVGPNVYCDNGTGGVNVFRLDSADDNGAPCYGVTTPNVAPWYIPAAQFNAVPEISVASSTTTSIFGKRVTFTVTGPSTATNSVEILDGTHGFGSCVLSGGTCHVSTSLLRVGNHSISAAYGGDSSFGAFTSAPITQSVITVPGQPQGATAAAGTGSVLVSWSPPASSGNSAITSYTVVATPGGGSCTTGSLSCLFTGLTNGTPYQFSITATNGAGTGDPTAVEGTPSTTGFNVYAIPEVVGNGHRFTVSVTGAAFNSPVRFTIAHHGSRTATSHTGSASAKFVVKKPGLYDVTAFNLAARTTTIVYIAKVTIPALNAGQIPITIVSAMPGSTLTVTTNDDGTYDVPVPSSGEVVVDLPLPTAPSAVHIVVSDDGAVIATRTVD